MKDFLKNIRNRILNKLAFQAPGGGSLRPWLQRRRGVKIGQNVWISQYVYFDELYPEQISIGDNSTIGLRVSIITHMHWGNKSINGYSAPVTIDKNVFVGPHCVILPNVHIGEGAVINAGTVVSRNVPPYTYWGNNPAGPLGQISMPLTREHSINEFRFGLRPKRDRRSPTHNQPS